jgi:hypothetical protein
MYFVSISKNRRMKPSKIVLGKGGGGRGRMMEEVNLRYIVSTYVKITMFSPVQLLYVNKIIKIFDPRVIIHSYHTLGFSYL